MSRAERLQKTRDKRKAIKEAKKRNQQAKKVSAKNKKALSLLDFEAEFCPIQLVMKIESAPTLDFDSSGKMVPNHDMDTIRVHISDQAHDPHRQIKRVLEGIGTQTNYFEEIIRMPNFEFNGPYTANHQVNARIHLKELKERFNLEIEPVTLQRTSGKVMRKHVYQVKSSVESLKRMLTTVYPSLNYGTDGSAIISADLGITNDSELLSVRMSEGPSDVENKPPPDLPLMVVPADLSIVMFGCPFVDFMQKYFIDFGTNTTLDSFYGVIGAEHEISPGKFETKLTLTPMDSYGRYVPLRQKAGNILLGDNQYKNMVVSSPSNTPPTTA